jgi:hypothetical protein
MGDIPPFFILSYGWWTYYLVGARYCSQVSLSLSCGLLTRNQLTKPTKDHDHEPWPPQGSWQQHQPEHGVKLKTGLKMVHLSVCNINLCRKDLDPLLHTHQYVGGLGFETPGKKHKWSFGWACAVMKPCPVQCRPISRISSVRNSPSTRLVADIIRKSILDKSCVDSLTWNLGPRIFPTMWGPQDISWFRFAPVTSSLFAYHKP